MDLGHKRCQAGSWAARTMFKPQSGKAYWDEQVARQSDDSGGSDRGGGHGYSRRSGGRDSSDDQG